jgi:hypothetical protein
METENIPKLTGNIAKNIREGYTGGSTDMYIPKPPKGIKVYCYDVNSLYPSVMINKEMPIGLPIKFIGDIRKFEENPFGFFYVKVTAPDNILHPIIQTHIKSSEGVRTISPIGN